MLNKNNGYRRVYLASLKEPTGGLHQCAALQVLVQSQTINALKGKENLLLELRPASLYQLGQIFRQIHLHRSSLLHVIKNILCILGPDLGTLQGVVNSAVVMH